MALVATQERDARTQLVSFALASGVPLACYLATASPFGYWFDSGEFVAASVELGISHPPGHPLAALVGSVATMVPLGPIPLRIALVSAVLTAFAAGFLFRAIETTLRALGVARQGVSVPIALGATWLVAGSYGWWIQAVRPEVYGLSAFLSFLAIERVVHQEALWPTRDLRALYVASFAVGLALANHHFLAFMLLPALAPTLARAHRSRGRRASFAGLAFVGLGLCTYAYLPVRAAAGPALDLGHPTSVSRFLWVVSAEAFQKNTGGGVPQPLWERFADIGVQVVEGFHVIVALLAVAGIYAVVRRRGARRFGYVWLTILIVFVAARAWLGFVRSNPDALGYLMPAFGAVGALAAAFVAAVLVAVGGAGDRKPRRTTVFVAAVIGLLGLAQVHATVQHASLAGFTATDAFDDEDLRALPTRAIVLAHGPQTIFRHWGARAVEELRPDVSLVPIPLLTYPDMVNALVERDPDLAEILRGYLLDGELRTTDLQSLAARRPLFIEMDSRIPRATYDTLVPSGLLHRVMPDEAYPDDRVAGGRSEAKAWLRLYALLGDGRDDPETRNTLLWKHYMSALYYAAVGEREQAREQVRHGQAINPLAVELTDLAAALADETVEGPLDVAPYLPRRLE